MPLTVKLESTVEPSKFSILVMAKLSPPVVVQVPAVILNVLAVKLMPLSTNVSVPAPPSAVSPLKIPPLVIMRISLPSPPDMVSKPPPPSMVSSPPLPIRTLPLVKAIFAPPPDVAEPPRSMFENVDEFAIVNVSVPLPPLIDCV